MGRRERGGAAEAAASILHSPWQKPAVPLRFQPPAAEPRGKGRALSLPWGWIPSGHTADQHQGRGEGHAPVGGGGRGRAGRMAVERAQHLQPAGSGPFLGEQLLAWIDAKAALPFRRRLPDIDRGPEPPQRPKRGDGSGRARAETAAPRSQKEGTALFRGRRIQQPIDQRQRLTTDADFRWRVQVDPTTFWPV